MKRAFLLLVALASLLCLLAQKRKSPKPPEVQVVEVMARRSEGVVTIDGRVRNCGLKPIRGLTLLFSMKAPGGQTVTTKKGAIEEELLEPNQESEFHWAMKDPVRAVEFQIEAVDSSTRELMVDKPGPYPVE